LREVPRDKIGLEERLEDWLEQDISIISDDLLVIGRQVRTTFEKYIDLLCIKRNGDVVIVELKKDKAPREVIAQVLEYASWVDDLSYEDISDIADNYLKEKEF
jgi:RecB family endonuclease NucS